MSVDTNPLLYFVCGGFGGICNVLIGYPLDTVKVRLQTMPVTPAGEVPLYSGTIDCFKKIVSGEGVVGLYKGMSAPLFAVAPVFATSFVGFKFGKMIVAPPPGKPFTYLHYFAAGAFSGIFTTTIMAPGERIKCLLQTQRGGDKKLYNGPIDCALKLYKQGGIRNIFRGSVVTLIRDVPASGLYFMSFELCKDFFTSHGKNELGLAGTIVSGGVAGVANWFVAMPADVLKSRLQTAPDGTYPNGFRDVAAKLIKVEGLRGFYKGLTPVLLRAFPANAACFVGFEFSKRILTSFFGFG